MCVVTGIEVKSRPERDTKEKDEGDGSVFFKEDERWNG